MVALDLRGYGETDAPSHKENYKLDFLITDIKDILESLGALVEDKLLSSWKKTQVYKYCHWFQNSCFSFTYAHSRHVEIQS